jgi:hypothetical protein
LPPHCSPGGCTALCHHSPPRRRVASLSDSEGPAAFGAEIGKRRRVRRDLLRRTPPWNVLARGNELGWNLDLGHKFSNRRLGSRGKRICLAAVADAEHWGGSHVRHCPGQNSRHWKPVPHRIDVVCPPISRSRCCASGGALPTAQESSKLSPPRNSDPSNW